MRVHEWGNGSSVALLLHGVPTRSQAFTPLAERLARTHRVLVPDMPGYNGEPALTGPDRFGQTIAALEELLVERGVTRVQVLGFSGGAFRAVALALGRRVQVTGLYLLGGWAGWDEPVRQAYRDLVQVIRSRTVDLRPSFPDRMLAPGEGAAHPEWAREVSSWLDVVSDTDLADELEVLAGAPDLRQRFAALEIPIVARVGSLDQACPAVWSEEMARLNPRVRLEIVPGRGHALTLDDAEDTTRSVLRAFGDAAL